MVADTFLSYDFEYSLRISTTDFSYLANSCIFEGNILRFRALASLKLFESSLQEVNDDHMYDNFLLLSTAIASLENSLTIYEAKEEMNEF